MGKVLDWYVGKYGIDQKLLQNVKLSKGHTTKCTKCGKENRWSHDSMYFKGTEFFSYDDLVCSYCGQVSFRANEDVIGAL